MMVLVVEGSLIAVGSFHNLIHLEQVRRWLRRIFGGRSIQELES